MAVSIPSAVTDALGGFFSNLPGQLGLQPSQAHYDASQQLENMVGERSLGYPMTGSEADYLKGRNLIETGFNPVLATVGAYPYQLWDEALPGLYPEVDPDQPPWGQRSLSDAMGQAWQNIRGIGSVVGARIKENPFAFLPAIFSSQVTSPSAGISPENLQMVESNSVQDALRGESQSMDQFKPGEAGGRIPGQLGPALAQTDVNPYVVQDALSGQPETFADMPTDPGWFSQLLKGLGAFYSPDVYGGEPWVDESVYVVPTDNPARKRAMMMGLNTENYNQHMRDVGVLEDKVNRGEMTLDQYHVESAKNLAQIQKDQGGFQANINALTGGALMGAQGAGWQYKSEFQKRNDPGYVGDWGDVASRDLAGNIQGISEVYGQPYRDIVKGADTALEGVVDWTKGLFQPRTESGVIDTNVTDPSMIDPTEFSTIRAPLGAATPVSQALQGIFPQGDPTSLLEEAQPPRSLPIGTPGWKPDIPAQTLLDPAKEAAATMGYLKPEEFGLDPFTDEQIAEARATFQRLMEGATEEEVSQYISPTADPYIYQDQIAEALRTAQADLTPLTGVQVAALSPPISKTEWFDRRSDDIRFPYPETGFQGLPPPISREQEIENMMIEDRAAQLRFHPASPLYEAPFEEGTGPGAVSEAQPMVVESFADIPETTWTPPAPVVPDITQEIADFSAIRDADEERRNREQDKLERELEKVADDRREAEQRERVATSRNKTAEKKRIAKENKERKAEEKRISSSQAKEEKKRRETEKMMTDMLKQMDETRQVYLDRKKKEEDRRRRQGYGVGAMYT